MTFRQNSPTMLCEVLMDHTKRDGCCRTAKYVAYTYNHCNGVFAKIWYVNSEKISSFVPKDEWVLINSVYKPILSIKPRYDWKIGTIVEVFHRIEGADGPISWWPGTIKEKKYSAGEQWMMRIEYSAKFSDWPDCEWVSCNRIRSVNNEMLFF